MPASDSTPKISHCSGQASGCTMVSSPVAMPAMPIHSRIPPGRNSSSASSTSPATTQDQWPLAAMKSTRAMTTAYGVGPALGGRLGRAAVGALPPKLSLAISAMPPMAPMMLEASSGIINSFWLGEVAMASSALM